MGKESGGSKVTYGHHYLMSMHMVLCQGPIDKIKEIRTTDDIIIHGEDISAATGGSNKITLAKPTLYGGPKKEGGIQGRILVMFGGKDQKPEPVLTDLIGGITKHTDYGVSGDYSNAFFKQIYTNTAYKSQYTPAFQGVTSVIWDDLLYQSNTSRPKGWKFKVERIPYHSSFPNAVIPQTVGLYSDPFNLSGVNSSGGITFTKTSVTAAKLGGETFTYDTDSNKANATAVHAFWLGTGTGKLLYCYSGRTNWGHIQGTDKNLGYYASQDSAAYNNGEPVTGKAWLRLDSGYKEAGDLALTNAILGSFSAPAGVVYPVAVAVAPGPAPTPEPATVIANEANPAYILLECLTNDVWGMGFVLTNSTHEFIDVGTFKTAAGVLFAEKFGMSAIWQTETSVEDFMATILQTINGVIYIDPQSGQFKLQLLRKEDASELILDESNILEVRNFVRTGVSELVNQLTVQWIDPVMGGPKSLTVHNPAARELQGHTVAVTKTYASVTNSKVAADLAARDLSLLSQSVANVEIIVNRSANNLRIGSVIDWYWSDYGIGTVTPEGLPTGGMSLRVSSISFGLISDGRITLKCVENIFKTNQTVYGLPAPIEFVDPVAKKPVPSPNIQVLNLSYLDLFRLKNSTTTAHPALLEVDIDSGVVAVLAEAPNNYSSQFHAKLGLTEAGEFSDVGTLRFIPTAVCATPLIRQSTTTIAISSALHLNQIRNLIKNVTDDKGNPYLACCQGAKVEMMQVTDIAENFSTITVRRGVINTSPQEFSTGAKLWFYSPFLDACVIDREFPDSAGIFIKVLTDADKGGVLNEMAEGVLKVPHVVKRWSDPYPVAAMTAALIDYSHVRVEWSNRDALALQEKIIPYGDTSLVSTPGIYYALKIFKSTGSTSSLVHTESHLVAKTTAKNQFTYTPTNADFDAGILFFAVKAVQDDRQSEWNYSVISLSGASLVGITVPDFGEYTPVQFSLAQHLTATIKGVDSKGVALNKDNVEGWQVFEGRSFTMRLGSDFEKLMSTQGSLYPDAAKFKAAWFDRYKIEVMDTLTGLPVMKRNPDYILGGEEAEFIPATHTTTSDTFEYSYDLNEEDHAGAVQGSPHPPARYIRLKVSVEDTAGNFSNTASEFFANPAPEITGVTFRNLDSKALDITMEINLMRDMKVDEVLVYGSKTTGFTADLNNLLYQGTSRVTKIPMEALDTWHYRVKVIDSFGLSNAEISNEFTVTPADLTGKSFNTVGFSITLAELGFKGDLDATANYDHRGLVVRDIAATAPTTNLVKLDSYVKSGEIGVAINYYPVYVWTGVAWGTQHWDLTDSRILNATNYNIYKLNSSKVFELITKAGTPDYAAMLINRDTFFDIHTFKIWKRGVNGLELAGSAGAPAGTIISADAIIGDLNDGVTIQTLLDLKNNYDTANDENSTTPANVLSASSEADIFEYGIGNAIVELSWTYPAYVKGSTSDIDGFYIKEHIDSTNAVYNFLAVADLGVTKRHSLLSQAYSYTATAGAANSWYSFSIMPYRITKDKQTGVLALIKGAPFLVAPYQPSTDVTFNGVDVAATFSTILDDGVISAGKETQALYNQFTKVKGIRDSWIARSAETGAASLEASVSVMNNAYVTLYTALYTTTYPEVNSAGKPLDPASSSPLLSATPGAQHNHTVSAIVLPALFKAFDDAVLEVERQNVIVLKALASGIDWSFLTDDELISVPERSSWSSNFSLVSQAYTKTTAEAAVYSINFGFVTSCLNTLDNLLKVKTRKKVVNGYQKATVADTPIISANMTTALWFEPKMDAQTLAGSFDDLYLQIHVLDEMIAGVKPVAVPMATAPVTSTLPTGSTITVTSSSPATQFVVQADGSLKDSDIDWAFLTKDELISVQERNAWSSKLLKASQDYTKVYGEASKLSLSTSAVWSAFTQLEGQLKTTLRHKVVAGSKKASTATTPIIYADMADALWFNNTAEAKLVVNYFDTFYNEVHLLDSLISAKVVAAVDTHIDKHSDNITTPATPTNLAIVFGTDPDHDGEIDTTVSWDWAGSADDIDGFIIWLQDSKISELLSYSNTNIPTLPGRKFVDKAARTFVYEVKAGRYVNFYVTAYRNVTKAIAYSAPIAAKVYDSKAKSFYLTSPLVKCYNTGTLPVVTEKYIPQNVKAATAPAGLKRGDHWLNTSEGVVSGISPFTWGKWNGTAFIQVSDADAAKRLPAVPQEDMTVTLTYEPPNNSGFFWYNSSGVTKSGVPKKSTAHWNSTHGLWEWLGWDASRYHFSGVAILASAITSFPYEGSLYFNPVTFQLFRARNGVWAEFVDLYSTEVGDTKPAKTLAKTRFYDKTGWVYYYRAKTTAEWKIADLRLLEPLKTITIPLPSGR